MFSEITERNNKTKIFILYTKNPIISMRFKEVLSQEGCVHSVYTHNVESGKDLGLTINNAKIKPFFGLNHLIVYENISDDVVKNVNKHIADVQGNAFVLLTTDNYKKLQSIESQIARLDDIMKQKVKVVRYTYLNKNRVLDMYQYLVMRYGYTVPDSVIKMLIKGYSRDINAVYNLFQMAAQGIKIYSEKQVVELVGIGNRDVDLTLQVLLTCSRGTNRKNANSIKKILVLLSALETEVGLKTTIIRLNHKINDYIKIKLLLQMGVIKDVKRIGDVPESFKEERLQYSYKYIDFLKRVPMRDLLEISKVLQAVLDSNDLKAGMLKAVCEVVS